MNTTRESAASQLKALRGNIVSSKAKFDDIASRFSDCSSAMGGGNLGQYMITFYISFSAKYVCVLFIVLSKTMFIRILESLMILKVSINFLP